MDSGDKATNKAMSAAFKYAAFQAFAIPTESDNDADSTTHEVKADLAIKFEEAASQGMPALQSFVSMIKGNDAKTYWMSNRDRLKAIAEQVKVAA